ncbi:hypothetical protein [Dietzia aurantiaca]|nr:hypothetical protein [Dietzia aurantiaca]
MDWEKVLAMIGAALYAASREGRAWYELLHKEPDKPDDTDE